MKAIFLLVSILVISLAISPVLTHVEAKKDSNIINSIDKALRKYSDKKKDKDLCSVLATKLSDPDGKKIWSKDCNNTPQPPKNQKPVIQPINQINAVINQTVNVNASISDPDGNITLVVWSQNSGPQASFISSNSSFWFIPAVNGTYEFQVKATDNSGDSSTEKFTVIVGSNNPQPEPCPTGTHREGNNCVPDPKPEPTPDNITKVALVGDLSGTGVRDKIKAITPDAVFALGDLTYGSNLGSYKTNWVNVFGDKSGCVIGNHDSTEDGSSSIYQEALIVCQDHWQQSFGSTTFLGINTNGDFKVPKFTISNDTKNVVILSHKPCVKTPPNSHHPLESSVTLFCEKVRESLPNNVKVYWVNGHNHVAANNADKTLFTSGAGGRSHYTCGTSSEWPFCNNQKYGFLEMDIDKNTGDISTQWKLQ